MKYYLLIFFSFLFIQGNAQSEENAILGKWESEAKNLIVDVYKEGDNFKAKITWFHDDDDTITPIQERLDIKNPDKDLRSRPIIGVDILSGLRYNAIKKRWVGGKIYDATSGRTWDATVWLTGPDALSVRGYYIFRWFGKTLSFFRVY